MPPGIARSDGMTLPASRTSSVLGVHEARHALGQQLRELRQHAGLTGRQLADSLSWPASKVSKLKNGRQTPTDEDIRGWASVTHAGAETESLYPSLPAAPYGISCTSRV